MISYYGGEYLVNFERYAQVLSQNFNVRIYLDGTRAETHEDNSIHLPNIKNMSEKELDCLYGILLHEIGHVKFTKLNRQDVRKMKGPDHFSIWNAIEDARIENKLMSKLEGANNIFEKLYGVHFVGLAKSIFGIDFGDDTDQWHLFGVHVHDYLLKTKRKYYNINNYSDTVKEAVLGLFEKAKPIIDAHKMTRAEHSLSLSTKLFKAFGPKRPEGLAQFKGVFSDIDKCRKELQEIYDSFKNNDELKQLKADKKSLEAKKKKLEKDMGKDSEVKKHDDAADMLTHVTNMIDHLQFFDEKLSLEKEIAALKDQIEMLELKLDKERELAQTMLSDIESMKKQKKGEGFDAEVLAQKKEELKRKKSFIKEVSKELKLLQRTLASKQKKLKEQNRATDYYNELKADNPFADLSKEQLEAKHEEALETYKATNEAANAGVREVAKVKNDLKQLKQEIKRINSENRARFKEALKKIEKRIGKNGLEELKSMPRFEKNEDWADSDKVQQEFDKQASAESDKLVNNGISGGSGERTRL
jgi:hypothetical protein